MIGSWDKNRQSCLNWTGRPNQNSFTYNAKLQCLYHFALMKKWLSQLVHQLYHCKNKIVINSHKFGLRQTNHPFKTGCQNRNISTRTTFLSSKNLNKYNLRVATNKSIIMSRTELSQLELFKKKTQSISACIYWTINQKWTVLNRNVPNRTSLL